MDSRLYVAFPEMKRGLDVYCAPRNWGVQSQVRGDEALLEGIISITDSLVEIVPGKDGIGAS